MAIQQTDAILLKRRNLRESSLILIFYTKDFGKFAGIAKGVRGPKAQLGVNPQLFSLSRIVFYESKRKRLNIVSQCDLKDFFENIRKDLERSVYAEYFLELTDSLTADYDKNEEIFGLLLNSLKSLCTPASPKRIARIFEIRFMNLAGLMPELGKCANCNNKVGDKARFSIQLGGALCENCFNHDANAVEISKGTVNFIEHVKNAPYERASMVKVSRIVGKELEGILRRFVDYHLQSKLNTIEFMRKIGMLAAGNAPQVKVQTF